RRVLTPRLRAAPDGGAPMNNPSIESEDRKRLGGEQRTYGVRMHAWALVALCSVMAALASCGARSGEHLAPLPPVSANTVAGQPEVNALYLIQAYDSLRVKFVYHPDLDTKVPVRPDGGINVTGVGEFQAAGNTTQQLAREIEKVSSDR